MTIIALFALVCAYSWILARIADKPTPKPDGFVLPDFETARRNLVELFTNISQSWKGEAYAELAYRLSYGLADCDDEDCEVCHPEGL